MSRWAKVLLLLLFLAVSLGGLLVRWLLVRPRRR